MPLEFVRPKLLLGEGLDEERFLGAFLQAEGLKDVQAVSYGGKTKLRAFVGAMRAVSGFSHVTSMGVTRDADGDFAAAEQSVISALSGARLPAPPHALFSGSQSPRVGVFILPGGRGKGALENICLASRGGDPAMACVDTFIDCARKAGRPVNEENKARAHAFLSMHEPPELRVGEAAQKGVWDFASPTFDELRAFVRAL